MSNAERSTFKGGGAGIRIHDQGTKTQRDRGGVMRENRTEPFFKTRGGAGGGGVLECWSGGGDSNSPQRTRRRHEGGVTKENRTEPVWKTQYGRQRCAPVVLTASSFHR